MPELPDLTIYIERLAERVAGERLERLRIGNPFVLRTVDPPVGAVEGLVVRDVTRIGKRIVLAFDDDVFAVIHLMIAGRLRWRPAGAALTRSRGLAAFDFAGGTVLLTEAGRKRRASLHLVRGRSGLEEFDRGGLEVMTADRGAFDAALRRENHTLKRALTDPRILSGVGNAYSDEILHAARLSPFKQTHTLTDEEMDRIFGAALKTLSEWTSRLQAETAGAFPEKVTAFRPEMAVHGRFGMPCPVCGTAVQRIVYAEHESNYCARCQTGGKLLADRALSRLLKRNWPRTIDELEGGG